MTDRIARTIAYALSRFVPRPIRRFWRIAWDANITGMSSMVAYNLLYGVIPVALLALFIGGHVLASNAIQNSVLRDLQEIFPGTAKGTLDTLLDHVRSSTTGTGILALVGSLWLGSMFWGSLDTGLQPDLRLLVAAVAAAEAIRAGDGVRRAPVPDRDGRGADRPEHPA